MAEYDAHDPLPQSAPEPAAPGTGGMLVPRVPGALAGLPTGTGIGKYRILERIRNLHNATVYKARDTMLDRLVAIKQMCPALIDNPVACGHFKREAQLLARVPKDARYVLNIHELIEDEVGLFIVEEFVSGDWLETLLTKRHVGVEGAVRILKTAAIGLRTLHQHQIVHRDIHPGNLMITRSGAARIGNFASAVHEGDFTPPPVISPKYSAPELLLDKTYDSRADIYSLGVVLFEVCVGRRAMDCYFADITNHSMPVARWMEWQADLKKSYPNPAELNPLVSPELAAIICQMTAKNLDDRFTSLQDVLDAMAGHIQEPAGRRAQWAIPALPQLPVLRPRPIAESWTPPPTVAPGESKATPQTSTQTVHTAAVDTEPRQLRPVEPWTPRSRTTPTGPATRRRPGPSPHRPPILTPRMPLVRAVPVVKEPIERHINRRRPRVIRALVAVFLFASCVSGYITWERHMSYVPEHPIERTLAEAWAAFDDFNYPLSRRLFKEAVSMEVQHPKHVGLKTEADRALHSLQLAGEAIKAQRFAEAETLIADARKLGVSPARVDELQARIWEGKDAITTGAQAYDDLRSGNFDAVDMKLDEYEKKAPSVGLEPSRLRDQLDVSKREKKYRESLKQAELTLAAGNFAAASAHVEDAENIKAPTSDTRDLRKRILDAESQRKAEKRGDEAMLQQDYRDAVTAYEEASSIKPSPELDIKLGQSRAFVNFNDARLALAKGNLLECEDRLRTSLWNHELSEARAKMNALQPAFEAAHEVRDADRAVEAGRFADAIKLYQGAVPRLPSPANEHTLKKIARAEAIQRGEQAFAAGRWLEAIEAFEKALTYGPDIVIQDRLMQAKARLPEMPRQRITPGE